MKSTVKVSDSYQSLVFFLILLLRWLVCPASTLVQLPDFTPLVHASAPAVVNLMVTLKQEKDDSGLQPWQLAQLPPSLQDFLRHMTPPTDTDPSLMSLGSGFIIDRDGLIVTNYHVIAHADEITVRLSDHREYIAHIIGQDIGTDLALLKINEHHLPTLAWGDSAKVQPGQWVMAIGSPFGYDHSVTAGVVSAVGRGLINEPYVPYIQTDVAINPGNSGGPLLNMAGQVIGINAQIISRTGGFLGISFAVPANTAHQVIDALIHHGHVQRGWLGVAFQMLDYQLAEALGIHKAQGALVSEVIPGGPAARAGIRVGDIILSFDGHLIQDTTDLPVFAQFTPIGHEVYVTVRHQGSVKRLKLRIGKIPVAEQKPVHLKQTSIAHFGIAVRPLTNEERQQLKLRHGMMVVHIDSTSPNKRLLQEGDIILQVGSVPLDSLTKLSYLLKHWPKQKIIAALVGRAKFPSGVIIVFLPLKTTSHKP